MNAIAKNGRNQGMNVTRTDKIGTTQSERLMRAAASSSPASSANTSTQAPNAMAPSIAAIWQEVPQNMRLSLAGVEGNTRSASVQSTAAASHMGWVKRAAHRI